jgi:hypothetical protein
LGSWEGDFKTIGVIPINREMPAANVVHGDAIVLECQAWLGQNLRPRGCCRRDGARVWLAQAHLPPLQGGHPLLSFGYVQALRIGEAKQVLEAGSTPSMRSVARSATRMRLVFRRLTGMFARRLPAPLQDFRLCAGDGATTGVAELALQSRL